MNLAKRRANESFSVAQEQAETTFITGQKPTPAPVLVQQRTNSTSPVRTGCDDNKLRLGQVQEELTKVSDCLDSKLTKLLARQECEYMSSFKYFVGKKEEEIGRLQDRLKRDDEESKRRESRRIKQLESYSEVKQKEAAFLAEMCKDSNKEALKWKSRVMNLSGDCSFLEKKVRSAMKEGKIFRYFVWQIELFLDEQLKSSATPEENNSGEFRAAMCKLLAGIRKFNRIEDLASVDDQLERFGDLVFSYAQKTVGPKSSVSANAKRSGSIQNRSETKAKSAMTTAAPSALGTKRESATTKEPLDSPVVDIVRHQQRELQEQRYMESLAQLKRVIDKLEKENRALKRRLVTADMRQNDLERAFVGCVEETKKQVLRRRFRQSPAKDGCSADAEHDLSQVEVMCKLSAVKERRISYENFTAADKKSVLELFLSNEDVIQRVYELMFPQRVSECDRLRESEPEMIQKLPDSIGASEHVSVRSSRKGSPRGPLRPIVKLRGRESHGRGSHDRGCEHSGEGAIAVENVQMVLPRLNVKMKQQQQPEETDIAGSNPHVGLNASLQVGRKKLIAGIRKAQ